MLDGLGTVSVGNEKIFCVDPREEGVRGDGEGVQERSLIWCLSMIPARRLDARRLESGE